jgi:hypothetical protein
VLVKSNARRSVPSLRHRGILSRQGCTSMKAAHPFSCTPVQLRKREKAKAFSLSRKRKLYRFSCSIQYLSSVVKSNITGVYIFEYTQLVMLTHYSPLRVWLPSVTLGHKHNQTLTTHTHTHTVIIWIRKTVIMRYCVNVHLGLQQYVFMYVCGKVDPNLESHFFSPEEISQNSRHTLHQLSLRRLSSSNLKSRKIVK